MPGAYATPDGISTDHEGVVLHAAAVHTINTYIAKSPTVEWSS